MSTNLNIQLSWNEHFKIWEQMNQKQLTKVYDMYVEEELLCGVVPYSYYSFIHRIYCEFPYLIGQTVLGHAINLN